MGIAIIAFILLMAILYAVLNTRSVQNRIVRIVTEQLSEKLSTRVIIGSVDFELFNKFVLSNFYIEGLEKDTLAYSHRIEAEFDIFKLLKRKVVFNKLEIKQLQGKYVIDDSGKSNIDFILEAFKNDKKRDSKEESSLEFQIRSVKILESSLSYQNRKHKVDKKELFNPSDIQLKDLNIDLSVDYFKGDSLKAKVKNISFVEKSGLALRNFKTEIEGLKKGLYFSDLSLTLPNSTLDFDNFSMKYDTISSMNDFTNQVMLSANLLPSKIYLPDLASFSKELKRLDQTTTVGGKLAGQISSFRIFDFFVNYGSNNTLLKADIDMNGITNLEELFVFANIKDLQLNKGDLQDVISKLTQKPFQFPKELNQLGRIKYKGNISGFFSNLVSYGNLYTDLGAIRTDILIKLTNRLQNLKYSGSLSSANFQLGKLMDNPVLGKTAFTLKTEGKNFSSSPFSGTVKGHVDEFYFNKYVYKDIILDGDYDAKSFDGSLQINDKNIVADFHGMIDASNKIPESNFDLKIENLDLKELHITDRYANAKLSFVGNANLSGGSLDDVDGFCVMNDLHFVNGKKSFDMDSLRVETYQLENKRYVQLESDIIKGGLQGDFDFSTLASSFTSFLQNYIPSLIVEQKTIHENDLQVHLQVNDISELSNALELPFSTRGTSTIQGSWDEKINSLEMSVQNPKLFLKGKEFNNTRLNIDNKIGVLSTNLLSDYVMNNDLLKINLKNKATNDSIYTNLAWNNSQAVEHSGQLKTTTSFSKAIGNKINTHIDILPTHLVLADSTWHIYPSKVDLVSTDSTIRIDHFKLQNGNQYLLVNGIGSKQENDKISLDLNGVDIGFFMNFIRLNSIKIAGEASGNVVVYRLLKKPIFESNLTVKNTLLNYTLIGETHILTNWDDVSEQILVSVSVVEQDKRVVAIEGMYNLKRDSLDFAFDTNQVNIGFLNQWTSSVFSDVSGVGSGGFRMYGKSKEITYEGNILVENTALTIGFLNTTYFITDTVYVSPKGIEVKNTTFRDEENNKGTVNGVISHDGHFRNFDYNIDIYPNKTLVLNTTAKDNPLFYGKAYASGKGNISGSQEEGKTYIDVSAKTENNTNFIISTSQSGTASDNSFVTFIQNTDSTKEDRRKNYLPLSQHNELIITLLLDVTPEADIKLMLNSEPQGMISANGGGNIRLKYNSLKEDLKLYGNYMIERGDFFFSLQDLIKKKFKIQEGGNLSWSGDVLKALLDIKAVYSLTASLRDLMNTEAVSSGRTSVPVDCSLKLTDQLTKPTLQFDINLPSSDETLKMQVKNLINTQETLNRQVANLLIFNKFYTPEYAYGDGDLSQNSQAGAFLNSLFTGQINSWLSQLDKNISLGFNYRTSSYGGEVSQEYQADVMLQPNSRLLVNGNFGYRDDQLAKNKIIGDVDVEYILTENRNWRLKAYNHTVDRYSLRSAPFIQGLGVMYKTSFDSWRDLWNDLLRKKQKKK